MMYDSAPQNIVTQHHRKYKTNQALITISHLFISVPESAFISFFFLNVGLCTRSNMLLKDYTTSHLLTIFSGLCGRRKLISGSLPTENMPVGTVETPKLPERKLLIKRERE